jgi:hypothetical protein
MWWVTWRWLYADRPPVACRLSLLLEGGRVLYRLSMGEKLCNRLYIVWGYSGVCRRHIGLSRSPKHELTIFRYCSFDIWSLWFDDRYGVVSDPMPCNTRLPRFVYRQGRMVVWQDFDNRIVYILNNNISWRIMVSNKRWTEIIWDLLLPLYEELDGPAVSALRRAIEEVKQRWSVIGWVTKIYYLELLRDSEGTFSRWSRLHLQSLTPTNPHWARVVGYGPFSLCVMCDPKRRPVPQQWGHDDDDDDYGILGYHVFKWLAMTTLT